METKVITENGVTVTVDAENGLEIGTGWALAPEWVTLGFDRFMESSAPIAGELAHQYRNRLTLRAELEGKPAPEHWPTFLYQRFGGNPV